MHFRFIQAGSWRVQIGAGLLEGGGHSEHMVSGPDGVKETDSAFPLEKGQVFIFEEAGHDAFTFCKTWGDCSSECTKDYTRLFWVSSIFFLHRFIS